YPLHRPLLSPLFPYTTLFRSPEMHSDFSRDCISDTTVALHLRCFRKGSRWRIGNRPEKVPTGTGDDGSGCGSAAAEDNAYIPAQDRKSTRLNSSHVKISYAVF